jgi:hypothetical protein
MFFSRLLDYFFQKFTIGQIEIRKICMPEILHTVDSVFGVSRDLPLNYVTREKVDNKLIDNLSRGCHIVIYGSSKQGKTSLRKHCLKDSDYDVVSCQNRWSLAEVHSSILKECGYTVRQSSAKTVTGSHKITASFGVKGGLPLVIKGNVSSDYEYQKQITKTDNQISLELDPGDVNDIIRALKEVEYSKFIVLEDFHYLPNETQRDMAFSLKAFHEKSKITFMIVGVWREENRLIAFNGDLTDRVFAVDVDKWTSDSLKEVISAGEKLLNVHFDVSFKEDLIKMCFSSVHIVQEVCRRCLRESNIYSTCETYTCIGKEIDVSNLISQVVDEQSGRYNGFLMNFSDGFQPTELEMPKWIIYSILKNSISSLEDGLRLRDITHIIKAAHVRGNELNTGNITQALISASALQVKKDIRPIIIDYDTTNKILQVVDKGFLIWLDSRDRQELLGDLG